MKNSAVIKALLLSALNEIAADPQKYAVNPGKDFTRNRKMGFHDTLLMLLTMEAGCIKEELYRYFGRNTDTPSKAAFYKQRKKLTNTALANLLYIFNNKLSKNLYFTEENTSSLPVMVLLLTSSVILTTRILSLSLMASQPRGSAKCISMPFTPFLTGDSQIS